MEESSMSKTSGFDVDSTMCLLLILAYLCLSEFVVLMKPEVVALLLGLLIDIV